LEPWHKFFEPWPKVLSPGRNFSSHTNQTLNLTVHLIEFAPYYLSAFFFELERIFLKVPKSSDRQMHGYCGAKFPLRIANVLHNDANFSSEVPLCWTPNLYFPRQKNSAVLGRLDLRGKKRNT